MCFHKNIHINLVSIQVFELLTHLKQSGPRFNIKMPCLTSVWNPIMEIRRSSDHLMSSMNITIYWMYVHLASFLHPRFRSSCHNKTINALFFCFFFNIWVWQNFTFWLTFRMKVKLDAAIVFINKSILCHDNKSYLILSYPFQQLTMGVLIY